MSGYIYQFGLQNLPHHTPRWNVSTPARKQLIRTLGGLFDPSGTERAELDLPYNITVSALALESSNSDLGASLDAYRAMLGKRDRLWLKPYDTTAVDRWCWARLADINYTGAYNNRIWQPVDLVFQALSGWYGASYGGAWNLDAGYLFDNGLYFDGEGATHLSEGLGGVVLGNFGNRTCTNIGISLTAGSASITAVTFAITSVAEWSWSGTLVSGNTLTIDTGARSVIGGAGNSAYSGFALGANHYSPYWLPIAPGGATVYITLTGGGTGSTVQFTYSDCFV